MVAHDHDHALEALLKSVEAVKDVLADVAHEGRCAAVGRVGFEPLSESIATVLGGDRERLTRQARALR
eukprot:6070421-Prymnesium_polylepis.1